MSLIPSSDKPGHLVVERTEMTVADQRDRRTGWERFIDAMRTTVGLKPLFLAERFAEAKVQQQEAIARNWNIEAEIKLVRARQDYEVTLAALRLREREAERSSRDDIEKHVRRLIDAKTMTPEEAIHELEDVIRRIERSGGYVELDLRTPPSLDEQGAED